MLPCHPERAFYYWRHGLWGHVIKVCELGSENKSASIFLYLYCGLAHVKLGATQTALTYLSRFRHRTDLSLVYQVTRYVVGRSLPSPDPDYLEEVHAEVLATIQNSNTLSIYYAAMVAWLFGERAVFRAVLQNAPDNWMLSLIRGWIALSSGQPDRAIARFRAVLEERAHSFDVLALYGLAMSHAALDEISDCVQTIARCLSKHDFPELNIERGRIYMFSGKWDLAYSTCCEFRESFFSGFEIDTIGSIIQLLKGESDRRALELLDQLIDDCVAFEKGNWRILVRLAFVLGLLCHQNLQILDRTIRLATLGANDDPFAATVLGYHQLLANNYVGALNTVLKTGQCDIFAVEFQIRLLLGTGRLLEAQDMLDMLRTVGYSSLVVTSLQARLSRKLTNANEAWVDGLLAALEDHLEGYQERPRMCEFTPLELPCERFLDNLISLRLDVIIEALDEAISFNRSTHLAPVGDVANRLRQILGRLLTIIPFFTPFLFFRVLLLKKERKHDEALYLLMVILVSKNAFRTSKCLFEAAEMLFEQNDTEFAVSCLEEAANKDPTIVSSIDFAILSAKTSREPGRLLPFIVPLFETERPPFLWFVAFIDLCIESGRLDIATAFIKKAATIVHHPAERALLLSRQAEVFAVQGKVEKAMKTLVKLKSHKRYEELGYITESKIWYREKEFGRFIDCLRAFAESAQTARAIELLGDGFMKLGDVAIASTVFRRGLQVDPSGESIIRSTIHCFVQSHRFEDAVALFMSSVSYLRGTGYAAIHLIELMIDLDRNEEAAQCILKVQKTLHSSNRHLMSEYLALQGTVYCNNKHFAESEKAFSEAIRLMEELCQTENQNPFVTRFHRKLSTIYGRAARTYAKLGQHDKSRESLLRALTHDDRNVDIITALFNHYKARYDVERCQKVCLDYLAIDPQNETVVLLLTSVANNFKEMIPHLEKVLIAKPKFYRTLVRMVEVCARAGRLQHAMTFIRSAESNDAGYFFVCGLYASLTGSVSGAQKLFKRSSLSHRWEIPSKIAMLELMINPDRKYVWLEKEPLAGDGDLAAAQTLRESLPLDKSTKDLLDGEILCSKNTDASICEALKVFRQVLNNFPGNVAASVGLARCLLRQGDIEKSSRMLDYVFAGKPFHETFAYFEEAYLMRARIVTTGTNFRSAQHFIFLALDLNLCCKKGWEMSAKVHLDRKMYQEASVAFGKCWELGNKADPDVGYNFAYCTMKAKHFHATLEICREMADLYPGYRDLRERVTIPAFRKMRLE
jgi:tetratricopeptide repeat protein 21B